MKQIKLEELQTEWLNMSHKHPAVGFYKHGVWHDRARHAVGTTLSHWRAGGNEDCQKGGEMPQMAPRGVATSVAKTIQER